jgi:flagellar basal body-associated protein FliL
MSDQINQPTEDFKKRILDIFIIVILAPAIVAAIIYFSALPSKVSAMEERQRTFEKSVEDMEMHLLIIRCRLKDPLACDILENERSK